MSYFIHAPGFGHNAIDEMAALGAAMWIGMHAPRVGNLSLKQCDQIFLQSQLAKTHVLLGAKQLNGGWTPLLWLSFAAFNARYEAQYVRHPDQALDAEAWNSGDRLWLLHMMTSRASTPEVKKAIGELFKGRTARFLSPSSHRLGQRIRVWRGQGVTFHDANGYWKSRPILA
jgi:hemolysin-activating ACP:hemolysin acyltransferase